MTLAGGNAPIGIHTICHAAGMAAGIDPAFLPFDVSASPEPERREMTHMLTFWRQGRHRAYAVSGLLPPKFSDKARMSGQAFVDFIRDNPDLSVRSLKGFAAAMRYSLMGGGKRLRPVLLLAAAGLGKVVAAWGDTARPVYPRSAVKPLQAIAVIETGAADKFALSEAELAEREVLRKAYLKAVTGQMSNILSTVTVVHHDGRDVTPAKLRAAQAAGMAV